MFYRKPIFEVLFGKRFVFQQAAPSEEAAPAPEAVAEAAEPVDVEPAKTEAEVRAGTQEELDSLKEEAPKQKDVVLDYWLKHGVSPGVSGTVKEDKDGCPDSEVDLIKKCDAGTYALMQIAIQHGSADKSRFVKDGSVDKSAVYGHFNESRGKTIYGFYYDGSVWREYDSTLYDDPFSGDFLDSWGRISVAIQEMGYNEVGKDVEKQKEIIRFISKNIGIAVAVSGAQKPDYMEASAAGGLKEGCGLIKRAHRAVIDNIKEKSKAEKGLVPFDFDLTFEEGSKEKAASYLPRNNDGLYMYYYDKSNDDIIAVSIEKDGGEGCKISKLPKCSNESVTWDQSNWKKVESDDEKKEVLAVVYEGVEETKQKQVYEKIKYKSIEAGGNSPGETSENDDLYLDFTKKEFPPVKFSFNLLDKSDSKGKLLVTLREKIKAKLSKDKGLNWTDAQIERAAVLRADDLMTRADEDLKEKLKDLYYDYEIVSKKSFEFNYVAGEPRLKTSVKLDEWRAEVDEVASEAEEKAEETLQEIITKAIKASGNENIDSAEVEKYVAEYGSLYGGDKKKAIDGYIKIMAMPFGLGALVLQFMGPIMKALKGSIGGLVDKAKAGGEKAADKMASTAESKEKKEPGLIASDIESCDRGRYVEKDGKREFAKLEQKFTLPAGVYEFDEINLPEQINVTDEGHFLRKGKRKRIKLAGGVEFPEGTKFKGIKVLGKSSEEASKFISVASASVASAPAESASAPETQVASAEPEETVPEAPETA